MACPAVKIIVGGEPISTSDFANAKEILTVSGDLGDPTADGFDENIAGGTNNVTGTAGIQIPPPKQLPGAAGEPGPITDKPKTENNKPPPGGNGVPVTCSAWSPTDSGPGTGYDYQLSPNYKVSDLTTKAYHKHAVKEVPGISASERICNLQALAVNVLEPLRAKFGNVLITSGLRNENTSSSGISQHVKGEAIDIQVPGWTYDKYWENAQWVKDNIKYDQFIFEHSSTTGLAWYHLSYNQSGNRPASNPRKVMTMYKNKYSPGLQKHF